MAEETSPGQCSLYIYANESNSLSEPPCCNCKDMSETLCAELISMCTPSQQEVTVGEASLSVLHGRKQSVRDVYMTFSLESRIDIGNCNLRFRQAQLYTTMSSEHPQDWNTTSLLSSQTRCCHSSQDDAY